VTERIESEDLTKPAVLRKKIVRHPVTANPFVAARHDIELKQNARKKGSAYYGGYETACRFSWKLNNPAGTPQKCNLAFPLPASSAMYDDLSATVNGMDVLPQMQLKDATLLLTRDLQPNAALDFKIAFKSRGVSFWYFQVREAREIRDFLLTLKLPDLPKARLNYPGGCMTPTDIQPTNNARGSVLTFRLDHAISNQGMGVALPSLPQPGEMTNAVLGEAERAWLLNFAMLALTLTLAQVRHAVLISILLGAATTSTPFGLPAHGSVWWSWTSPFSGEGQIQVTNGSGALRLAAFKGDTLSNLPFWPRTPMRPTGIQFFIEEGLAYPTVADSGTALSTTFRLSYVAAPLRLITSSGLKLRAPGTFLLEAETPGSSVQSLGFLAGTNLLAVVTNAPYQFQWSVSEAGNYLLRAEATNPTGDKLVSLTKPVHIGPANDDFAAATEFAHPNTFFPVPLDRTCPAQRFLLQFYAFEKRNIRCDPKSKAARCACPACLPTASLPER
jgi:hypothetical protein